MDQLGSDEEYEISDDGMEAETDDDDDDADQSSANENLKSDAESDSGSETEANNATKDSAGDEKDKNVIYGNFGWADAMSKVLKASKPKNKKSVVLAKARKDVDVLKAKALLEKDTPLSFKIEGEIAEVKPETKEVKKTETHAEKMLRKQKRKEWDLIGRKKPDITQDWEREKTLSRIATRYE